MAELLFCERFGASCNAVHRFIADENPSSEAVARQHKVPTEGADIFLDFFFTIHELQKSCVSIPEKLSDVVSSYQARTSEFPQEEFLRRGAAFLVSREQPTSGRTVDVDPVSFSEFHWACAAQ